MCHSYKNTLNFTMRSVHLNLELSKGKKEQISSNPCCKVFPLRTYLLTDKFSYKLDKNDIK